MSTSPELAILPVLPPLETSSKRAGSGDLPMQTDKDTTNFQSPSLSFAESFSTALSSPGDESEETSRLPLSSLSPPQSLRKSISVDSFAQYSREVSRSYSNDSPEPSRNNVYGTQTAANVRTSEQLWSGRHRGESLSSVHQDHDTSSPPDSDVDRHDSLNDVNLTERFRRISLKAQDPSRSFVRAGDLPLPSRARNNSTTVTSIVASARDRGTLPSVSSMSSLQSPSVIRGSTHDINVGRMRSGSLGYNPPSSSRRTVINPHIPPHNRNSGPSQTIVLAVIGTTGCGKSTVIRKGLSQYGLTEATVISESSHPSRLPRYKRRTSSLTVELPGSPTSPVATSQPSNIDSIEIEIQTTANGTLQWPQGLPPIDGVIVCYDLSNKSSYEPVERLLKVYRTTNLPIMVLGCKSDLDPEVESNDSLRMLKKYDTGLIEVSNANEEGKEKMRQSFQYMLKAVVRQRGSKRCLDNRNPAAPPPLEPKGTPTPWTDTETDSSLGSPSIPSPNGNTSMINDNHKPQIPDSSTPPTNAQSPIWVQSTTIPSIDTQLTSTSQDVNAVDSVTTPVEIGIPPTVPDEILQLIPNERRVVREPRPAQWADLDALLDKLLFLAVSGEEPNFITNFLLTYRRFCIPRHVLLAMQKRMRQLDNPCGDPMFACFAQMRICHLLELWIRDYPHDFSVKGTSGALNALIKSIISKTHLLHYGSEFLPFLEQLPSLKDQDAAWAKKVDILEVGGDESDGEDDETRVGDTESFETSQNIPPPAVSPKVSFPSRDRKSSIPLTKPSTLPSQSNNFHQSSHDQSPKQQIKELVKLAQEVLNTDSTEIAQEITRTGVKRFMLIQPRDWLHYTFVSGKKTESDSITAFNAMSNHLADWVVSLILCHERPRHRARQIEKFVEIAQKLRNMNNYSALRAFVAGINNATDDPTMEYFKAKSPDASKYLLSWDVLLQQVRAHRAYRLALRNSKGACIPALEVHMTDLIRAHEGNGDTNPNYPTKIHWGKFNMMGRFITSTLQCQAQCRNSNDYDFPERPAIAELFFKRPVMTTEMQKSRLKSQDFDYDDVLPHSPPKDIAGLRKLFFW